MNLNVNQISYGFIEKENITNRLMQKFLDNNNILIYFSLYFNLLIF